MKYKMILLLLTSFLVPSIKSETGNAFHGPTQARELFAYNNRYYYYYNDRVPYDEAGAICEAGDMHLATLDDPGKAKFAAQCISETWMTFEDMWIGARKKDQGHWVWDWTGQRLPEESQIIGNFTYMYPPWIDNACPARDGKDCMAIDRNGHSDPYFVDLDCKVPRPFICEENNKFNTNDPTTNGAIKIFDIDFIIYHARLSWSAAVSFCRQQGYTLATIDNMSVAIKLAQAMLKARPEFEDAWIGANLKEDEWVWVENGEEIKPIPGEYIDPDKGDILGNTIIPQFPPWIDAGGRARQCAIFDRHLCESPTFIDLKCNRERDFICMKREKEFEKGSDIFVVDRARKRYIFFPVVATWDEAKKICEEESDSTTMLNLTDIDETKFVIQAMADSRRPLDHIWLGGKLINGVWQWIKREDDFDGSVPIPTRSDETGFPPWCDNETSFETGCLNLDRQNHWTPLIYGLECNTTQAVVCVQPIEPTDRIVQYEGANEEDPCVILRVTKLIRNPLSWLEAETACKKEIGKLWRPRFELEGINTSLNKFFATLKEGQTNETGVYYLDGGFYEQKRKSWVHNKRILNITTNWVPNQGDCLVVHINTTEEWIFQPVKCYHKLFAQVICEPQCSLSEVPYEKTPAEWICDAGSSHIFDHKMLRMGCTHHCHEDRALQGPDRYYCGKQGWFSTQANIPVTRSICTDLPRSLDAFKNISNVTTKLAFIIDSTSDSPTDYDAAKYLIANLVDYYQTHLTNLSIFVVSIETDSDSGKEAILKVNDVRPTDCDSITKTILEPLVDAGDGIANYAAGLEKIKETLKDTPLAEITLVFLAPEANQKGLFREKAREINGDAKVFAIGTNKNAPISQLVDIASNVDEESYAIQFKKPKDLVQSVKALVKDCNDCKCTTAFDYLVANLGEVSNKEMVTVGDEEE